MTTENEGRKGPDCPELTCRFEHRVIRGREYLVRVYSLARPAPPLPLEVSPYSVGFGAYIGRGRRLHTPPEVP